MDDEATDLATAFPLDSFFLGPIAKGTARKIVVKVEETCKRWRRVADNGEAATKIRVANE